MIIPVGKFGVKISALLKLELCVYKKKKSSNLIKDKPDFFSDKRGRFARLFCIKEFEKNARRAYNFADKFFGVI